MTLQAEESGKLAEVAAGCPLSTGKVLLGGGASANTAGGEPYLLGKLLYNGPRFTNQWFVAYELANKSPEAVTIFVVATAYCAEMK